MANASSTKSSSSSDLALMTKPLARFETSKSITHDIQKTRSTFDQRRDLLTTKIRFAETLVLKAARELESIPRKIDKNVGATISQTALLISRDKAYKKEVDHEDALRKKKKYLYDRARKIESKACDFMKNTEKLWFGLYKSIVPVDPGKAQIGTENNPEEDSVHADSAREVKLEKYKLTQEQTEDEIKVILDAAGKLRNWRRQVAENRSQLQVHQLTFKSQFSTYASRKQRKKDDLSSEFAQEFHRRGRAIFRRMREAEDAYKNAKQTAKNVGIPPENVEYPDEDFDDEDQESDMDAEEEEHINFNALKRKKLEEDHYDPTCVSPWVEDLGRLGKRNREIELDKDEKSQLLDYVPLEPSDSYSFTIEDPELQEKLEVHKQQAEVRRQNFLAERTGFGADFRRLKAANEEPGEKKGEDEEMTDVLLDEDPMDEWFQCPSTITHWEDRWACRRHSTEARSRKKRSSV